MINHLISTVHNNIDFSCIKNYDNSLSKHIRVTLIEKVKVDPQDSRAEKESKCEAREGFWQTQLKTLHVYGGLNKRDNRKYVTERQQAKDNQVTK